MFGEAPELYDRARPGYSDEVVEDVLAFGGLDPAASRALEIGAGTGKATVAFASHGVRVLAIEPDPSMAAVAVRNCRAYPGVRVALSTFEDWELRDGAFDLVYCAQAWHWLRPEIRAARAAATLVPGGCLALLWHRVRWAEGDPFRAQLDECYRTYAPGVHARGPGFPGLTPSGLEEAVQGELSACAAFADVSLHEHPWVQSFDVAAYVDRLRTQSDHRLLPTHELERLLQAVAGVIEERGGEVTVPHSTLVVLARRVPGVALA